MVYHHRQPLLALVNVFSLLAQCAHKNRRCAATGNALYHAAYTIIAYSK